MRSAPSVAAACCRPAKRGPIEVAFHCMTFHASQISQNESQIGSQTRVGGFDCVHRSIIVTPVEFSEKKQRETLIRTMRANVGRTLISLNQ